jgi:hypothetical protein
VLLRAAPLALAALALTACGGGKSTASTTTAQSQLPPGCSAQQAQAIVTQFLAHPSFAPPSFFAGYRSQESDHRVFQAKSAAAAAAHLQARQRLGERDRLLQLQVYPVDVNHVHIVFTVTRSAPDFLARGIHFRIASGSGTLDCAHGKVAQWSQNGP